MKIFKKAVSLTLSLALLTGAAFTIPACGGASGGDDGNLSHGAGEWNDYNGVSVGFVEAELCPEAEINDELIFADKELEAGKTYYMVTDFKMKPEYDNDGDEMLIAGINVAPAAAIAATVQDAASGMLTEVVSDGETVITIPYRIPESADDEQTQRIVVQITPLFGGAPEIDFSFKSNGVQEGVVKTEGFKRVLNVGYTKNLGYERYTDPESGEEYYSLTGKGEATGSTVSIPYTIDGLIVNRIEDEAFKGDTALRRVIIPDSVTYIGASAFEDCTYLTDVTIPATTEEFGDRAFENCGDFEYIEYENGEYLGTPAKPHKYLLDIVTAYDDFEIASDTETICAYSLNRVKYSTWTVPDSVKVIGSYAFNTCPVWEIELPESVTRLGDRAFYNCKNLTDVKLPASLTSIGLNPFSGCDKLESIEVAAYNPNYKSENNCILSKNGKTLYTGNSTGSIPSGVKTIGEYAFESVKTIEGTLNILSGVSAIGACAFDGCGLTGVSFPSSLIYIGNSAFRGNKFPAINLPEGVAAIGASAFSSNAAASITIPESVISIGAKAFAYCDNLETVNFNAVSCGDLAESASPFAPSYKGYGVTPHAIGTVNFGENVKRIPANLFVPDNSYFSRVVSVLIKRINFNDGLEEIGNRAFYSVKGLVLGATSSVNFELPEGLKIIGEQAFAYCSVSGIVLPASLREIRIEAFKGSSLFRVIMSENEELAICDDAFDDCKGMYVYLKSETVPYFYILRKQIVYAEPVLDENGEPVLDDDGCEIYEDEDRLEYVKGLQVGATGFFPNTTAFFLYSATDKEYTGNSNTTKIYGYWRYKDGRPVQWIYK